VGFWEEPPGALGYRWLVPATPEPSPGRAPVFLTEEVDAEGDGRLVSLDGSFRLRAASVGDIDGLLGMWLEAAENLSRPTDTREAVASLLDRDPEAVIVAERDGELIGSVIAGWDGWRCHLYRLAVRPQWRRKGVASALLRAAEDRFRALGARRADAMVLDSNDLGRNLWLASGYQRQDDWRRWVKPI
jgi:GNAT superfamily N-acetyltransferase